MSKRAPPCRGAVQSDPGLRGFHDPDSVVCRMCGRVFRAITYSHLVRKHHLPEGPEVVQEYKRDFNVPYACCDDTRRVLHRVQVSTWDRRGRWWTPSRVVDLILRRAVEEKPLHTYGLKRERCTPLVNNAVRFFGSWDNAVAKAGINGSVKKLPKWTRDRIVEAVKARWASGNPVYVKAMIKDAYGLLQAGTYHLGSWRAVLQAAGVPETARRAPKPRPQPRKWPRERVIEVFRKRYESGMPVFYAALRRSQRGLVSAVRRYYRRWQDALKAAGIPAHAWAAPPLRWTREGIIRAIQDRHRTHKGVYYAALGEGGENLYAAGQRLFGTWKAALQAAGVPAEAWRAPRKWSWGRVVEAIREMHRAGKPVYMKEVKRENPSLYSAAFIHGKGWHAALQAAGIPKEVRDAPKKWAPERVLGMVRERFQAGKPLNFTAVWPIEGGALYAMGCKYFGSWKATLRAAGIPGRV